MLSALRDFRQEGDMGRYIAFNDPGQPGAGFSSYQDYLAASNPPIVDNRPQYNPFEGYDFMKGFQDSEFYKKANQMQQDAVNFKFDGKDMMMNSSMAGALRQYLNSIGKGDLYQSNLVNNGALVGTNKPEEVGILGDLGLFDNPIKEIIGGPGPADNIANYGGSDVGPNINPTPVDNTGIGSLTPTPVNQIPESSSIAGSITSPYLNNNQDFDEYLNSYINNQINTRMRDIFSGIMNIFK